MAYAELEADSSRSSRLRFEEVLGRQYADRGPFREIANDSAISFILMIAYKLRFNTDVIVIGTFLSATAITYFSIGDQRRDFASAVVQSGLDFRTNVWTVRWARRTDLLRKILVVRNRVCALIIFPITAVGNTWKIGNRSLGWGQVMFRQAIRFC